MTSKTNFKHTLRNLRQKSEIRHEDLLQQFWKNEGEIPDDGLDNDNNGYIDNYMDWNALKGNDEHYSTVPHGTMVAGLASATTNNERGIAAVARNAKLLLNSKINPLAQVLTDKISLSLKENLIINYASTISFSIPS